jgi:hypothetical protein
MPFLAFTYSSYSRANLSFEKILEARPKLHEKGTAVMVLGATRVLDVDDQHASDLSAAHYSSFLIADAVAQRYYGGGGGGDPPPTRIFERSDLTATQVGSGHDVKEHAGEDAAFCGDKKLNELFWRTVSGDNTAEDIKKHRGAAISRLHEVVVSSDEYGTMRGLLGACLSTPRT